MRYYDIRISDAGTRQLTVPYPFRTSIIFPSAGALLPPTSVLGDTSYTSFVNNKNEPNALDIELQVRLIGYGNSAGTTKQGSFVKIFGVSLPEIGQQFNMYRKNIVIQAGMMKGLPFAKPEQAGVIVAGTIWQALGNWEGPDKTLELMIVDASVNPTNFQFLWEKGQPLINAIRRALSSSSLSNEKVIEAIDSRLVNNTGRNIGGAYSTLETFSAAVQSLTKVPPFSGFKTVTGSPYQGVIIYKRPGRNPRISSSTPGVRAATGDILVTDNTRIYQDNRTPADPLQLNYEDFVGQPVWIGPYVVSFKMVMRADLRLGDYVRFPDKFGSIFGIQTQGGAVGGDQSASRNRLAFRESFQVRSIFHNGRFRSPAATSWVTTFEAIFTKIPIAGGGTAP